MDNKRPDYFDRYFDEEDETKEQSEKKEIEEESKPEEDKTSEGEVDNRDYFDESLFTEDVEEEQPEEAIDDVQIEEKVEKKDIEETEQNQTETAEDLFEEPIIEKEVTEEPKVKEKPPLEDYEDTKMQKLNLKPLIIGGAAVVVLILIVFGIYNWFFVNGGDVAIEAPAQPVISPQEQLKKEQEKKKIAFLKNITGQKKSRLNFISNLSDLKINNISYASILLYSDEFSFEIFGKSREDIAKFNLNIKNKKLDDKYKIVFVSSRPGSKGGIFALYKAKISPQSASTASLADPQIKSNIKSFVENIARKNSLSTKADRQVSRKKADQFDFQRTEFTYRGSEANCINFLKDLSQANNNFNVHKISLLPTNQQDFGKAKYQLLIVLDFYV